MRGDGTVLAVGVAALLAGAAAWRSRRGSTAVLDTFEHREGRDGVHSRGDEEVEEQSFVMFKPLALERALVPELIREMSRAGVRFEACVPVRVSAQKMAQHYAEHRGKPFFDKLISYYDGKTVLACRVSGQPGLVRRIRSMLGPSDPLKAIPGRHLRALAIPYARQGRTEGVDNLVHASDSMAAADRQLELWGLLPAQQMPVARQQRQQMFAK